MRNPPCAIPHSKLVFRVRGAADRLAGMRNWTRRCVGGGAATVAVMAAVYFGGGCSGDVRMGGGDVRNVEVRPVTHYGMTLDSSATPQQVAYVALRAIGDEVQAKTAADRETAVNVQFDVAAANAIAARNKTKLDNDEFVYSAVYHWTPTVSYYAAGFPQAVEEAESRLIQRTATDDEAELAMELADPKSDPNGQVVMLVWLAKDKGLWRVVHFGFDQRRTLQAARPSPVEPAEPRG